MANYKYNGVPLPDIQSVWNGTGYAMLVEFTTASAAFYGGEYGLVFSDYIYEHEPLALYAPDAVEPDDETTYPVVWILKNGVWTEVRNTEEFVLIDEGTGTAFWANYDIAETDGSVYLAASDPVEVEDTGGGTDEPDDGGDDPDEPDDEPDVMYAIRKSTLTAIADAIRGKNGSTAEYTPAEMAAAIEEL